METLSIVVSYFGVVVLYIALVQFLFKRTLEKIVNRIIAIHAAVLFLDGDAIYLEALKREYKKITQGDLLNYEAIEIIDEVQKMLEKDQAVDLVGGVKVFEEIKSEIPKNKDVDQWGCSVIVLALPILGGFLWFRSGVDSSREEIIYSLLIAVPGFLLLRHLYSGWSWFFSAMRRRGEFRREYVSRLRGRAKLS